MIGEADDRRQRRVDAAGGDRLGERGKARVRRHDRRRHGCAGTRCCRVYRQTVLLLRSAHGIGRRLQRVQRGAQNTFLAHRRQTVERRLVGDVHLIGQSLDHAVHRVEIGLAIGGNRRQWGQLDARPLGQRRLGLPGGPIVMHLAGTGCRWRRRRRPIRQRGAGRDRIPAKHWRRRRRKHRIGTHGFCQCSARAERRQRGLGPDMVGGRRATENARRLGGRRRHRGRALGERRHRRHCSLADGGGSWPLPGAQMRAPARCACRRRAGGATFRRATSSSRRLTS